MDKEIGKTGPFEKGNNGICKTFQTFKKSIVDPMASDIRISILLMSNTLAFLLLHVYH